MWEKLATPFRLTGDGARGPGAEAAGKPAHEKDADAATQDPDEPSGHLDP